MDRGSDIRPHQPQPCGVRDAIQGWGRQTYEVYTERPTWVISSREPDVELVDGLLALLAQLMHLRLRSRTSMTNAAAEPPPPRNPSS